MDDLISRQQTIDALKSRKTAEQSSAGIMRNAVVDFCIGIIKKLPSIQPEQRLIPCSERLPEIDKDVLVTDGELCWVCSLFESPDIEDGLYQWEYNYGHWYEFETWVAWMPLPEIYQEGGEADE